MKKILVSMMAIVGLVFTLQVQSAFATPILELYDGTTTVSITDGGALDSNPLSGSVTFIGSIGDWVLNVTTGTTKPIIGTAITPMMDMSSQNISSKAGNLTMTFSEDLFGPFSGSLLSSLVSNALQTAAGTISSDVKVFDQNNNLISISSIGPMTLDFDGFSGTSSAAVNASYPSTIEMTVNINHTSAGLSSFDSAAKVPEPGTLLLLGSGLMGIAFYRRRKA